MTQRSRRRAVIASLRDFPQNHFLECQVARVTKRAPRLSEISVVTESTSAGTKKIHKNCDLLGFCVNQYPYTTYSAAAEYLFIHPKCRRHLNSIKFVIMPHDVRALYETLFSPGWVLREFPRLKRLELLFHIRNRCTRHVRLKHIARCFADLDEVIVTVNVCDCVRSCASLNLALEQLTSARNVAQLRLNIHLINVCQLQFPLERLLELLLTTSRTNVACTTINFGCCTQVRTDDLAYHRACRLMQLLHRSFQGVHSVEHKIQKVSLRDLSLQVNWRRKGNQNRVAAMCPKLLCATLVEYDHHISHV